MAEAGIGVDIVEISRMKSILEKTPSFARRVFTEEERAYCDASSRPAAHYASRFASREAVLKALGTGFSQGVGRKDVSVTRDKLGKPKALLSGRAYAVTGDRIECDFTVNGLGLGAAMPNAVTLTSEYCPDRQRAMLTNAMFCGFPLGAAFGGFLASWMIPHWGWRSVLVLGGVTPLILMVVMLLVLPESVRYMVAKGQPVERIRRILVRISQTAASASAFVLTEQKAAARDGEAPAKSGMGVVLGKRYRFGSLMLWLSYFMGLVIFYALINWMPILLKDAGMDPHKATLVAALFPLGGVGAVFFGWLMDRFEANRIIAIGYALTAVAIWWIGQVAGNLGWLVVAVFAAGTIMNTAQSSLPALAAAFYPTEGRATGVAWMMAIGRFGGIAGSFLVAALAARELSFSQIFTVLALPGLIAMAALIVKQIAAPKAAPQVAAPIAS